MSELIPLVERGKFQDPQWTADGSHRATVPMVALRTVWFNIGTLCNLTCRNCYIESSPKNDRLAYLSLAEFESYLAEISDHQLPVTELGFTGGEPFMNADLVPMICTGVDAGFRVLVLTNAMKPMMKCADALADLTAAQKQRLEFRVSLDHYSAALHEAERGPRSWQPTVAGLRWLAEHGYRISIAGRTYTVETEEEVRNGFQSLFDELGLQLDARDARDLTLFPELEAQAEVPEITTACWSLLGVNPADVMCASSRMVVKRKGAMQPTVVACTLLPYDSGFEVGPSLVQAQQTAISLNHRHCATFCVLGGSSCS